MRERSEQLKRHVHGLLDAGVRRTTFFAAAAESLRQTEGEPPAVRRAKAQAHVLDCAGQTVLPYELITGSILGTWPLADDAPPAEELADEACGAVREYVSDREAGVERTARWALMARDHYDASVGYRELQELAQQAADRVGNVTYGEAFGVLEDHFVFDYGEDRRLVEELPWLASNHLHLNYKRALPDGLAGIRRAVERSRAGAEGGQDFYDSAQFALEGVVRFIRRYAETLAAQAATPATPRARSRELEEMADVCRHVAEGPPRTFREALQLVWLLHVIGNLVGGSALSFARLDQYLFPFLERDLADGAITRDGAKELIECFWLKVNEPKMRTVQSICLGGRDADGRDATNELSLICLEVAAGAGEPYPNTIARMHAASPKPVWDRVVDCIMTGIGQPQIFNDDALLPGLVRAGFPPEEAANYYPMGCVEVMVEGVQPTYKGAGSVRLPDLMATSSRPRGSKGSVRSRTSCKPTWR